MGPIDSKALSFFYRSLVIAFQSQLVTHENLHSYFSDCLLLYNDIMQCVFVARLVLFRTMILIKQVWLLLSATTGIVTHESLHSYFSDCLLLYNNTMKCALVAHSLPCKTMTLNRPTSYLKYMYISFA